MGLSFQDPTSSLTHLTVLTDELTPHRYLPAHHNTFRSHHRRAQCDLSDIPTGSGRSQSHHLPNLHHRISRQRQPSSSRSTNNPSHQQLTRNDRATRVQSSHRQRRRWESDAAEGYDLAVSSGVSLPYDRERERQKRPPSLERQDAFRDGRCTATATAAGRGVTLTSPASRDHTSISSQYSRGDAAHDEELYRLGVLYDNEYERGAGFGLDGIVHREPVYHYRVQHRVRQVRRGRRPQRNGRRRDESSKSSMSPEREEMVLDLALSFAALGDDEALKKFLSGEGEGEVLDRLHCSVEMGKEKGVVGGEMLRVLYELEDADKDQEDGEVEEVEEKAELEFEEGAADLAMEEFPCHASDDGSCFECLEYSSDEDWGRRVEEDVGMEVESATEKDDSTATGSPFNADVWVVLGSDGS